VSKVPDSADLNNQKNGAQSQTHDKDWISPQHFDNFARAWSTTDFGNDAIGKTDERHPLLDLAKCTAELEALLASRDLKLGEIGHA
jgi:hypothetical protein